MSGCESIIENFAVQVCLDICSRSWSSSKSSSTRNLPKSNQGKSNGSLYVSSLGNFLLLLFFPSIRLYVFLLQVQVEIKTCNICEI